MDTFFRAFSNFWGSIFFVVCCLSSLAQVVTISSPSNQSKISSPVHYVASASSPQCPKGIAAMRIYLADHIVAYNGKADSIDTLLSLSPGNYNSVVQAWDNCGGVGKTAVNITVTATGLQPIRFLYIADGYSDRVLGFNVNPATGVPSPTAQGSVAMEDSYRLTTDKNGYRVYGINGSSSIYAYFIDRRNGYLSAVPGSPFSSGNFGIWSLGVHPSGKWVFAGAASEDGGNGISVFKVNADGSFTLQNSTPVPTQSSPDSVVVEYWGRYVYVMSQTAIDAFYIDTLTGALTPVPGSPYKVSDFVSGCLPSHGAMTESYGRFLYLSDRGSFNLGYGIAGATGSLRDLSGSPFPDSSDCGGITTEPTGRFVYVSNASWPVASVSIYSINAGNGALTHLKDTTVSDGFGGRYGLHVDPSGRFLYLMGSDFLGRFFVFGFSIDEQSGDLTALPGSPFSVSAQWAFDFALTP